MSRSHTISHSALLAHLRKANQLLALLSIPLRVQHLNELTPAVWTVVYEALFRTSLDVSAGVAYGDTEATASTAPPSTPDERNRRTMERITRTLERSVIRMSLSHISVDGLVEGRLVDVCQLLDLFLELARSIAVRLRERRVLTADVEGTLAGASPSGRGHTGMAADPVLSSLRRDTTPPPMVHRAGGGSYAQLIDDVVEVTEEREDDARPSPSTTVRAVPSKPATSLSQLVDDIPTYITGGLANNANSGRGGAPRQRQSRSPKRLFPQQRGSPKKARQAVRSRPADASARPAPAATAQAPTKELRFADPKVDELQLATASLEDRYHKTAGIGSPAKRQVITTTTITDYRPRTVKLSTSGVRSGTAASKSSLATPQLRVRSMTLPADEAAQAMRNVTRLIEDTLPGVDIPDWYVVECGDLMQSSN